MAYRAIARRGDDVWLITEEEGDNPKDGRVLDLRQLKLFPPFNVQSILARGYWQPVDAA